MGKAAQYWNNYIGEVISKSKPVHPDSVKSLVCLLFSLLVFIYLLFYLSNFLLQNIFISQEKPKKITSAGVGPRGLSALKSTFENKVSIKLDGF